MQQKIEREDCNPTRNNGNAKYKRVLYFTQQQSSLKKNARKKINNFMAHHQQACGRDPNTETHAANVYGTCRCSQPNLMGCCTACIMEWMERGEKKKIHIYLYKKKHTAERWESESPNRANRHARSRWPLRRKKKEKRKEKSSSTSSSSLFWKCALSAKRQTIVCWSSCSVQIQTAGQATTAANIALL